MIIDHIGYVIPDISSAIKRFLDVYGLTFKGEIVYDSAQRVKLAMLNSDNDYNIELIQPIDSKSPSYDYMEKGGGFHHFCYMVENLDKKIVDMKKNGHILIKNPVEAKLFNGRRVAFLFSKADRQIVELVEKADS